MLLLSQGKAVTQEAWHVKLHLFHEKSIISSQTLPSLGVRWELLACLWQRPCHVLILSFWLDCPWPRPLWGPKSGICRLCGNFPNSLRPPKSLLWAVEGPQCPWLLLLSYVAFVKSSVIRAVYTKNFNSRRWNKYLPDVIRALSSVPFLQSNLGHLHLVSMTMEQAGCWDLFEITFYFSQLRQAVLNSLSGTDWPSSFHRETFNAEARKRGFGGGGQAARPGLLLAFSLGEVTFWYHYPSSW